MASVKAAWKGFLQGVAWLLLTVGGLSFLVGGGLIHAETKTDRLTAELEGLGFAAICLIAGVSVKSIAEDIPDSDEDAEQKGGLSPKK